MPDPIKTPSTSIAALALAGGGAPKAIRRNAMTHSKALTAVLPLLLASCAGFADDRQVPTPAPAYVPQASQAPLLSGATVTGDTIREDD